MKNVDEIISRARQRAQSMGLNYRGAVTPREAYELLSHTPGAKLVDVRSRAEWDWVGHVPGAIQIEWNQYPGGVRNPDFLAELKSQVDLQAPVLFLCRSGVRSDGAAQSATEAGYLHCYNILEGFEGDKDNNSHRNTVGGWRHAGLPWIQG